MTMFDWKFGTLLIDGNLFVYDVEEISGHALQMQATRIGCTAS
jgi:hypothetical protein